MIDPHRRCGSTGRAGSTSTFAASSSSSSCGSRLGNREVEHGENDGVDEWHVAGDYGGCEGGGGGGGESPGGAGRGGSGRGFGFLGQAQPETGGRGHARPVRAGCG